MKYKTMFDKIWERHVIHEGENQPSIIYIDLHLINEVTSPQAFSELNKKNREVRRPDLTFATIDHVIPTTGDYTDIKNSMFQMQIDSLFENCKRFGIKIFDHESQEQGILHVIGPELGLTHPGKIIVCGDSHTSTHGAFGALAFGIGTSEVEHVLTTQCLQQIKPKNLEISIKGNLPKSTTAKDLILYIISKYGIDFATGYVIEYTGETIRNMSMEERMTICNMSIEAGGRAGLISPDERTFEYLKERKFVPKGVGYQNLVNEWRKFYTDPGAKFDKRIEINAELIEPQVSWGTNPGMTKGISESIPDLNSFNSEDEQKSFQKAIDYIGLKPGTPISEIKIDSVFIGSCTNSRISDLREAAKVVKGYKVSPNVKAIVVPGSIQVKKQAESEGLDKIFENAGFEWRNPGCSLCIAMNTDILKNGERCASTSNRNFEGRQGRNAKTHLVSPSMAAAAAIKGTFYDVRKWTYK